MKHFRIVTLLAFLAAIRLAAAPRGVEILWDKFGVPHIYAQNMEGLFFGYGYAQMQSHGDLVLKLYGESRGRAAEYWGEKGGGPVLFGSGSNLENDRWVRLNGAPERADQWLAQQSPEYQRCFAAFAEGMNTYAERHPEKLDPARRKVLPIRPVDSLLHVHKIVHFGYLSGMRTVESAAKALSGDAGAGAAGESNAWAIAPSRTAAGHTLLLMNPHLPWGDWSTYYEAQLVAPGIGLYGSSQIGFPMLRFVFSDFLGFTQTVNSIDASDLYRLTLSPDGQGYVYDGAVRPFEQSEQTLRILQADGSFREERLVVRKSVHGPVVWDKGGVTLAVRTAGLDRPFMIEQYWKMALARSFPEYETQLKRLQVPTFNITYADRDGHIMCSYNGTLPKRATGDAKYWAGVIPGDTSATLWTEVHPYEDLPKVVDPMSGWVQNTNNPPWIGTFPGLLDPAKYPASIGGGQLSLRTMNSLRMLHDTPSMTFDELVAKKHSTHFELADRVLDDLLATAEKTGSDEAKRAAAVLKAWDRRCDNESRGALLFEAFAGKFMGPAFLSMKNFAVAPDWHQPLTTPRGLKDAALAVKMLEDAAAETIKRYGALDAPWGEFRRFQIGATDLPGNGGDGNLGVFRVTRYAPVAKGSPKQKATFGDTFAALVEFGTPVRAQVLTSYGNSSQPGSPHNEDQLPLLSQERMRPALIRRADVEANLESRDAF
ncbi:MAG: acylase [Verrucomicrobia bacterium]|nr:acylase [Verrucomicrobiota bacterium]